MKVFSMFSGIGGFELAFRNQGHEIVGACEIDDYARQIHQKHFKGITLYNDAKDLHPQSLPQFDMLCAGFPCQAFSIAGKRRGFDDTRGSLFFEIARIAKEKKPSYLLLENVKGLLSHDKGETFRTIIRTLDEMGYDAEWQVLNSKYFVPQNRERVFIIGHLRGRRTRQIFPLGDFNEETDRKIKHQINSDSQAERVYDIEGIGPTLGIGAAMSKPLIGVVNDKKSLRQVENSTCIDANYFKGHDNHGARTMVIKEGMRIRKLTPKECERLQGFPDDWTKGVSDTQRYKMCGNAVTVPVIEYIIKNLIQ